MKLRVRIDQAPFNALRGRLPALEAAARARLLARLQASAGGTASASPAAEPDPFAAATVTTAADPPVA